VQGRKAEPQGRASPPERISQMQAHATNVDLREFSECSAAVSNFSELVRAISITCQIRSLLRRVTGKTLCPPPSPPLRGGIVQARSARQSSSVCRDFSCKHGRHYHASHQALQHQASHFPRRHERRCRSRPCCSRHQCGRSRYLPCSRSFF
jgi:hypothetical protein